MLPVLGKKYDERRLRLLLALLFLALALPTGAVIWQAYGRLEWEAFHQYRSQAEELTARIDTAISDSIAAAEDRSFAAYSFLNVTGDPGAGFLQRSPLSAFPVLQDLPGVIGYFQIDAQGRFSTPLLPGPDASASALGIGDSEYNERQVLAGTIRQILTENEVTEGAETADKPASQEFFDELSQAYRPTTETGQTLGGEAREASAPTVGARQYAKVQDLRLDDALQKKSEVVEEEKEKDDAADRAQAREPDAIVSNRARRVEQAALPEPQAAGNLSADLDQAGGEVRITTFESEVDPFEFAMLASGEFVLFRKVWREGERFVQGILIDQGDFLDEAILAPFHATTLSAVSDLAVAFDDDVLRLAGSRDEGGYASGPPGIEGDLLYRGKLTSPLDSIQLIFSLERLPAGPGASVLGWTTFLLVAVFGAGFLALYRLGLGQIRLARQQQDFVSSVSHELKTPLTSIRMYSEMLKEGWADEAKRRQYYEFIHDESERLSRLIANVLQLASITRNEPSFELRPVSAGELLDHVRSRISSQAERAGFELVIEADADARDAMIEVDEDCMMQIVINLVDNAIKFSRSAEVRRIEIGARKTADGTVRFRVRDHGPGIPREQMKKIFRLFYRPESELTRETVGTGIGLAIVHQLTQAMGGKVDVINCSPGAEFGVTFPGSSTGPAK